MSVMPPVRPGPVRETVFARSVTVRRPPADPFARLSGREMEVLRAVCTHENGVVAAHDVFIGYQHLRNVLGAVYHKLGIGGDGKGKAARACYALGRRDEHEGHGS